MESSSHSLIDIFNWLYRASDKRLCRGSVKDANLTKITTDHGHARGRQIAIHDSQQVLGVIVDFKPHAVTDFIAPQSANINLRPRFDIGPAR
jgi:hypothetical protein